MKLKTKNRKTTKWNIFAGIISWNKKTKRVSRSKSGNVAIFTFLGIFAAFQIIPVIFTVSTSFKPMSELLLFPPTILVRNPTINNFSELFRLASNTWVPFSRYLFNSLFNTVLGTVLVILVSSLAAYPLSKHKMPFKKVLNYVVILALMLSADVSGMTVFIIMNRFGIIDTAGTIIIPTLAGSFGVFLLKQFMDQIIPDSLLDSAKIDGAGEFRIWAFIVMPTIKPAWITLGILTMQGLWNNPGTMIYTEQRKTLPFAMQQMMSSGIIRMGAGAAVGVLLLILPLIAFVASQKNVVETMATSGIKE